MRVCYFGTYESEDSRNILLMKALEENNVQVIPAHMSYWKFKRAGVNKYLLFLINSFNNLKLFYKYFFKVGKHDLIVLGSPGEKDINFARFLAFIKRKKIILDTYPSISSKDAKKVDLLLVDTPQKAEYLSKKLNIGLNKFKVIPFSSKFFEKNEQKENKKFIINVLGDITNQNLDLILQTKKAIGETMELNLIKVNPKKESQIKNKKSLVAFIFKIIKRLLPKKKEIIGSKDPNYKFIEEEQLKDIILSSKICWVFDDLNDLEKSLPKEAFQVLSLNKPLLIEETDATKEAFSKGVIFYKKDSIIKVLQKLKNDTYYLKQVSKNGHDLFEEKYNLKKVGKEFVEALEKLFV